MKIESRVRALKVAAAITIGFGIVIAAAAVPALSLPTVFLLELVIPQLNGESMSASSIRLLAAISGGVLTGWLTARLVIWIMTHLARYELAQVSVSVALPYLAFIFAEQSVGASGVIAVVTAGMTLNLLGPGRIAPAAWSSLREVWDLLAYWAGALIFILAALLIPRLLEEVRLSDFLLLGVVILAATGARAIILFGLLPLLSRLRLSPKVEPNYRAAILWGGLHLSFAAWRPRFTNAS